MGGDLGDSGEASIEELLLVVKLAPVSGCGSISITSKDVLGSRLLSG